jgi:predicted nucleic acid-binding protein
MAGPLLFDTDVIIDYLRGTASAVAYLEKQHRPFCVSVITITELYAGIRDSGEAGQLEDFLRSFEVITVTREIGQTAGTLCRTFRKSHGIGLGDAIIAATVAAAKATLVTLNKKHFPLLHDVIVPYQKK